MVFLYIVALYTLLVFNGDYNSFFFRLTLFFYGIIACAYYGVFWVDCQLFAHFLVLKILIRLLGLNIGINI
jgi:hypothetical protein